MPRFRPSLLFLILASTLPGHLQPSRDQTLRRVGVLPGRSAEPLGVRAIAAGGRHSAVLAWDGTIWAWGDNSEGQLGNQASASPPAPAEVYALGGVVAVSAGYAHTLALKHDGTVWAWGKNREAQLGDGTSVNRASPVQVKDLAGVVGVAAGNSYSLALEHDGTVWAWGGIPGEATGRTVATPVQGLSDIAALAAGQAHCLALRRDGTVWAWGNNSYGQLGNATVTPMVWPPQPSTPAQVPGLPEITAIAAGYQHSMALAADGSVWVWGHDGVFAILRPTPIQVLGLAGVQAIAAGMGTSLALKPDGTVWQWGYDYFFRNAYSSPTLRSTPTQVTQLTDVRTVALPAGSGHGLALKRDGTLWEWGAFPITQLGQATMARPAPRQVTGLSDIAALSPGLALKSDGTVWTWDAPYTWGWLDRSAPFQVAGVAGVAAIASGSTGYNLALKKDGSVWNIMGAAQTSAVPNLSEVASIASGDSRALAVKRDGTVWEWSGVNAPAVQVAELADVVSVAEAFEWWSGFEGGSIQVRSVALKRDGTVWTWDGAWGKTKPAVQVTGLSDITAIAAGEVSLALKLDGTVWQWDATSDVPFAAQVSGVDHVTAIAIGGAQPAFLDENQAHALALKVDGTVWAWGPNSLGQLGDGTTAYREAPIQVAGLSEVATIAAASSSSAAVKRDGTVWGWGAAPARFGNGSSAWEPSQVPALGSPDLAVLLTHSGDFIVGDLGVYTISLANVGRVATSGPITLSDSLPPGLTFISALGDGWNCAESRRVVTCVAPGPINPAASTIVALTVRVESDAFPGVTNLVTVSNESDFSDWNNTAGDPTRVLRGP